MDAYNREGELLETFENCPGLHGEATLGNTAAFGCAEGVLLIRAEGGELTTAKRANPPGLAGGDYISTIRAHERAAHFVGSVGDALAWIGPEAEMVNLIALDATPLRLRQHRRIRRRTDRRRPLSSPRGRLG